MWRWNTKITATAASIHTLYSWIRKLVPQSVDSFDRRKINAICSVSSLTLSSHLPISFAVFDREFVRFSLLIYHITGDGVCFTHEKLDKSKHHAMFSFVTVSIYYRIFPKNSISFFPYIAVRIKYAIWSNLCNG